MLGIMTSSCLQARQSAPMPTSCSRSRFTSAMAMYRRMKSAASWSERGTNLNLCETTESQSKRMVHMRALTSVCWARKFWPGAHARGRDRSRNLGGGGLLRGR
eukprot:scaffold6562_cov120-Isochrysis_galbana.AAC.5